MLGRSQVDFVKAGVLYGDHIDLVCANAQFTVWLADLLEAPNRILHNLVRGVRIGESVLQKHGKAGPWAVRRILNDQIPGLVDMNDWEADQAIDAYKKRLIEGGNEENEGREEWRQLRKAIDAGRMRLIDFVHTEPDRGSVPNRYVWDNFEVLQDALSRTDRAVLVDAEFAAFVRSKAGLSYTSVAESRAGEAAYGTAMIERLPTFPEAPMDEVLGLSKELDGPLRRYRVAAAELRRKAVAGPFDKDFNEAADHLWRAEVKPSIDGLKDELQSHTWVQSILAQREKVISGLSLGAGPGLVVGLAPHAAFLSPQVIAALTAPGPVVGAGFAFLAGARILWDSVTDNRAKRQVLEQHNLFYLHTLDSRL